MTSADTRWVGLWRGGRRVEAVDPFDRGLAYGDGLFETMRAADGALPWWRRHRERLLRGAERLGIAPPADSVLDEALAEAIAVAPEGVIKLVLTRGAGARGYAPGSSEAPTLLVSVSPAPPPTPRPLEVDLLEIRLGIQPALAGMKHLNRLEQVLGAAEAERCGLDDGLMLDTDGALTCSTRANVFVQIDGHWLTPPVDRAGIAGIVRELLLEHWPGVRVERIDANRLPRVDALFLTNAVRGILPAGRCGGRVLDPSPEGLKTARAALAASHPAFREP